MAKHDVSEFIGKEWIEGRSDCIYVVSDALHDMGFDDAAMSILNATGQGAPGWSAVQQPYVMGDVVLSAGECSRNHVSVVYDDHRMRVLTSAKKVGAFTCRFSTIKNVIGVYRHGIGPV